MIHLWLLHLLFWQLFGAERMWQHDRKKICKITVKCVHEKHLNPWHKGGFQLQWNQQVANYNTGRPLVSVRTVPDKDSEMIYHLTCWIHILKQSFVYQRTDIKKAPCPFLKDAASFHITAVFDAAGWIPVSSVTRLIAVNPRQAF